MSRDSNPRLWFFFFLVTLVLAMPLAIAYLYLGQLLVVNAASNHRVDMKNRLNQWQEQLYDMNWDSRADTYDDTLYLGLRDEGRSLKETLRWYVYPNGDCFVEGMAVINPDGSLGKGRQAAVIDDQGQPFDAERISQMKKERPWIDNPWLGNYGFVIDAFERDHEALHFTSSLIEAPGRQVFIIASVKRGPSGRPLAAVMMQMSVRQFFEIVIKPSASGTSLWLMDQAGSLGFATSKIAEQSARLFASSGGMKRAFERAVKAQDSDGLGAGGTANQVIGGKPAILTYRTEEANFILGVVETKEALASMGNRALRSFWLVAVLSLLILAVGGAVYTLAAVRRKTLTVEKETLRRYAGAVSHRVRNDLVAILGTHEMISEGVLTDPEEIKKKISGETSRAVNRIQDTVEDLERLSRGEAELHFDGQAGNNTMIKVKPSSNDGDEK